MGQVQQMGAILCKLTSIECLACTPLAAGKSLAAGKCAASHWALALRVPLSVDCWRVTVGLPCSARLALLPQALSDASPQLQHTHGQTPDCSTEWSAANGVINSIDY